MFVCVCECVRKLSFGSEYQNTYEWREEKTMPIKQRHLATVAKKET